MASQLHSVCTHCWLWRPPVSWLPSFYRLRLLVFLVSVFLIVANVELSDSWTLEASNFLFLFLLFTNFSCCYFGYLPLFTEWFLGGHFFVATVELSDFSTLVAISLAVSGNSLATFLFFFLLLLFFYWKLLQPDWTRQRHLCSCLNKNA